jgi:hypothetical protein
MGLSVSIFCTIRLAAGLASIGLLPVWLTARSPRLPTRGRGLIHRFGVLLNPPPSHPLGRHANDHVARGEEENSELTSCAASHGAAR